jgi:hypothetical protein
VWEVLALLSSGSFQGPGGLGQSYMPIQKSLSEVEPHDTAMTRHKANHPAVISSANSRHHVARPTEKMREPVNREVIFCAPAVLSATPFAYSLGRDDSDSVVFCFAKPEDAEAFAERFSRKRLPTPGDEGRDIKRKAHIRG